MKTLAEYLVLLPKAKGEEFTRLLNEAIVAALRESLEKPVENEH